MHRRDVDPILLIHPAIPRIWALEDATQPRRRRRQPPRPSVLRRLVTLVAGIWR